MARSQTGIRNRCRTGTSKYSDSGKGKMADYYGDWTNGKQNRAEIIAGTKLPLVEGTRPWLQPQFTPRYLLEPNN